MVKIYRILWSSKITFHYLERGPIHIQTHKTGLASKIRLWNSTLYLIVLSSTILTPNPTSPPQKKKKYCKVFPKTRIVLGKAVSSCRQGNASRQLHFLHLNGECRAQGHSALPEPRQTHRTQLGACELSVGKIWCWAVRQWQLQLWLHPHLVSAVIWICVILFSFCFFHPGQNELLPPAMQV